jgi:hypothetical protein
MPSTATRAPGRSSRGRPARPRPAPRLRGCRCRRAVGAVSGRSAMSPAMAAPARPRARASSQRPSRMSVTMTAAASKYTWRPASGTADGAKVTRVDQAQAALVPSTTRLFMSGARRRSAGMPRRKNTAPGPARTRVVSGIASRAAASVRWSSAASDGRPATDVRPSRPRRPEASGAPRSRRHACRVRSRHDTSAARLSPRGSAGDRVTRASMCAGARRNRPRGADDLGLAGREVHPRPGHAGHLQKRRFGPRHAGAAMQVVEAQPMAAVAARSVTG